LKRDQKVEAIHPHEIEPNKKIKKNHYNGTKKIWQWFVY